MSSVEVPERVFIDPRVAKTMNTEPFVTPGTGDPIAYVREDVVVRRLTEARGQEFVVQIQSIMEQAGDVRAEYLVALTTHGRVFERKGPDWILVDLPEFET